MIEELKNKHSKYIEEYDAYQDEDVKNEAIKEATNITLSFCINVLKDIQNANDFQIVYTRLTHKIIELEIELEKLIKK